MNDMWDNSLVVLLPTLLVGLIFWLVMRSIVHADRTERKIYSKLEAQERKRMGLPEKSPEN